MMLSKKTEGFGKELMYREGGLTPLDFRLHDAKPVAERSSILTQIFCWPAL